MTPLSPMERAALLGVARAAILERLGGPAAPAAPSQGRLGEPAGAFVSVSVRGELRGCIGTFRPTGGLAQTVAEMAVAAAREDPRFPPVSAGEVAELGIAVSVLGPPRRLADPGALEVGRHGVIVRRGWHRGALLPHVAVQHGWDGRTFLRHACLKAGLPARAWEEPGTEVEIFEADEFGEEPTA